MDPLCPPKAVVLLSGGVDSTTCLAVARKEGFELYALSFFYHQRHEIEIHSAKRVAAAFHVKEHLILELPLNRIGGSALTDRIEVPKDIPRAERERRIPVTYVPARNTIFLSLALGWAEVLGAADLFIGVNAVDYSGYPDCRPQFIRAFQAMANLALKATVEDRMEVHIHTPLIHMSKAQIIRCGIELGVDYSLTHSCYDPDPGGRACGRCDSCLLRAKGFLEAGIPDPATEG
ncbi:MAG: 7-cyano-7-deazaguanine synthase QueC [Syntrophobacteraceae bacterium]|nr:7-cyano-7-deazaguanine synthase QueC [Syntrophobacteraceae bacterium]